MLTDRQRAELDKQGVSNVRVLLMHASPDPAGILLGRKGGDIKVGDAVEWLAEQDAKEAKDRKWTLIMAIIAAFGAIVGMIGLGGH